MSIDKLLIEEYPLMVLPSLAVAIGLNEAIVLQQVHYWLRSSSHEHEGRKWIYNTIPQWNEQFPFWSEKTVKRTLTSLANKGVLLRSNFNKRKSDRTTWYSVDYDVLKVLSSPKGQNDPMEGTDCPDDPIILSPALPETTTETTSETTDKIQRTNEKVIFIKSEFFSGSLETLKDEVFAASKEYIPANGRTPEKLRETFGRVMDWHLQIQYLVHRDKPEDADIRYSKLLAYYIHRYRELKLFTADARLRSVCTVLQVEPHEVPLNRKKLDDALRIVKAKLPEGEGISAYAEWYKRRIDTAGWVLSMQSLAARSTITQFLREREEVVYEKRPTQSQV